MIRKLVLACGIYLLVFNLAVQGQHNKIIPVGDPAYHFINKLQHHGYLLELNPTSLPYIERDVEASLSKIEIEKLTPVEQQWHEQLEHLLVSSQKPGQESISYGIDFKGGLDISNHKRLNTLRPLKEDLFAYPSGSLGGYLENSNFIGHALIRHNLYYDQHPDGIDVGRRLYIRAEDSYLGYNRDLLDIYMGRFKNHWAPFGETSSILSSNPFSYDQINIRFGTDHLSFRGVMAELDNISGNGVYTGRSYQADSKSRFLVAHRFDWRPTPHFGIAFFESIIYSGEGTGFSLKYFNPMLTYTFLSDNAPKNDENNLLFGGLLWARWNGFTINGQLMFDDIQAETNIEKNTFTITGSLVKANAFKNIDIGGEFEAVSYQTYNPEQAEGRYLYLKTGLATQFNDYVRGELYADIYPHSWIAGLRITPKLELLLQGEQTINQPLVKTYPDGSPIDIILTGDEQRTLRPGLEFRFQNTPYFWIEGDVGINALSDYLHQPGVDKTQVTAMLELGFDFTLLNSK